MLHDTIQPNTIETIYKNFFKTPPLWAGKYFLLVNFGYLLLITLFEVVTNFSIQSPLMQIIRYTGVVMIISMNMYFASRKKK